jgi:ribonuclease HII
MPAGHFPSLKFEKEAWKAGALWVAGVDEAGAGPLAGPVTAGAVALPAGRIYPWYKRVNDSKVLSARAREHLAAEIKATVPWAVGWADHEEIDAINIYQARKRAMVRAIELLEVAPDQIISDALPLPIPNVRAVIDGDAQSIAVGAASVIAKTARDAFMVEMCEKYHGYAFCRNKGYPTPEHKRLLALRGPCPIHRLTFGPVAQQALLL